jgi:predicted PurR-regulated permease PerM
MTSGQSYSWFLLALLVLAGWLLYQLAPIITPFAAAAGLAYLSDPLVDRLETWGVGSWKLGRTLAVTLVFILLVALFVIALLVLIPMLVRQTRDMIDQMPAFFEWVTGTAWPWLAGWLGVQQDFPVTEEVTELFAKYWQQVSGAALNVLETLGRGGKAVVTLLTNLVLIPVVAFYLMRDWDRLVAGAQNLLPRKRVAVISALAAEIDEVLSAFIRGQLLVMIALGIIYSLGLWMMGLQGAFLIGMAAGLLSVVPYLGSIVGLLLAVLVALFQFGDLLHFALVLVVFGVGQSLEGMVLTPNLVGDRIGLHPVTVIFAVLAGGQLFGFLGILLALPAAAAINVVVRHVHDIYQHSAWYSK